MTRRFGTNVPGSHMASQPPWAAMSATGQPPTAQPGTQCPTCGTVGSLQPRADRITRKRRHKFGLLWLLITLCTLGFGFLLWLVMPRYKETIAVDRYVVCTACGARQS